MKQVKNVDWNDPRLIRSGIIPYYVTNSGIVLYAFGVEEKVAGLCDFGGHKENIDIDCLDSALREYDEECLSIFGRLDRQIVQDCFVLEGIDTNEILVKVSNTISPFSYSYHFYQLIKGNTKHEIQQIIWLTTDQLVFFLHHPEIKMFYMYYRIRKTLLKYFGGVDVDDPITTPINPSRNNCLYTFYNTHLSPQEPARYCYDVIRECSLVVLTLVNEILSQSRDVFVDDLIEQIESYPNICRCHLYNARDIVMSLIVQGIM